MPDREGACLFHFKEHHLQLFFEYDDSLVPHTILLSCDICLVPLEVMTGILEACLIHNSRSEETLSCRPEDNLLFLHRRIHPKIKAQDLKPLLNSFIDLIKQWKEKVRQQSLAPPKQPPVTPSPSFISCRSRFNF